MDNADPLLNELRQCTPDRIKYLFYQLLLRKVVVFTDLVNAYTTYLETTNNERQALIVDLASCAVCLHDNVGDKKLTEEKFAAAVVKSGIFGGTQYEKELKEKISKENSNESV